MGVIPKICPCCGKGQYKYGSALYAYYTCNHAYEKPLNADEKGKFVYYPSPYEKKR